MAYSEKIKARRTGRACTDTKRIRAMRPRELCGFVVDFDGYLRQRGRILPVVMRAEQKFQEIGEQDPDVSPGAAAVTAVCAVSDAARTWARAETTPLDRSVGLSVGWR